MSDTPRNVSADTPDLNAEDQVYETDDGYRVKVKVLWESLSEHGAEMFLVTGAIVGSDGKAKLRADGSPAVHQLGRRHYLYSDAMVDPVVGLEKARLACVAETVRAEKHHQMIGGYGAQAQGLASQAAFMARKAAEGAPVDIGAAGVSRRPIPPPATLEQHQQPQEG